MATAILAMLPPTAVVMLMQKWFVRRPGGYREISLDHDPSHL
jgi:ABC-type maltose transport system permease subunit